MMRPKTSLFVTVGFGLFLTFHFSLFTFTAAQTEFPKPTGKFVNDFANILDPGAEQQLEDAVRAIQKDTSAEVAVVTVSTLNNMSVEEYAVRLFKEWGIGRAKEDNGVLVLVSTEDRDIRIEVGYGLEGVIPDGLAGEIIRTQIAPRFKDSDFAGGLRGAVARIGELVRANRVLTPEERAALDQGAATELPVWAMIPFLSIFVGLGALAIGIGLRTKTYFPILFGGIFGFVGTMIGLVAAFVPAALAFAVVAFIMGRFGYRKAASPSWRASARGGTAAAAGTGWIMGATSSSSSSSGSDSGLGWSSGGGSDSFGGGSSGGGGASGKW
jgi:uncharacterized protein